MTLGTRKVNWPERLEEDFELTDLQIIHSATSRMFCRSARTARHVTIITIFLTFGKSLVVSNTRSYSQMLNTPMGNPHTIFILLVFTEFRFNSYLPMVDKITETLLKVCLTLNNLWLIRK